VIDTTERNDCWHKIKLANLSGIASSSYLSTYPDSTESNFVYAIIRAQGHVETWDRRAREFDWNHYMHFCLRCHTHMTIGIVTETQKQLLKRDISMFKDIKNTREQKRARGRENERYINYFDNLKMINVTKKSATPSWHIKRDCRWRKIIRTISSANYISQSRKILLRRTSWLERTFSLWSSWRSFPQTYVWYVSIDTKYRKMFIAIKLYTYIFQLDSSIQFALRKITIISRDIYHQVI